MSTAARGRPRRTSRDEVARTALALFVRDGFDETTVSDVAAELGVARRTMFRYFESKNDMVWGDFDWVLNRLRTALQEAPDAATIMETLCRAVMESNYYEGDSLEDLRLRMTLITTVPALQAHSMLRYAEWRGVVAEFVAGRLNQEVDDHVPMLVGHMALGTSMAAFARWVEHPSESLEDHLRAGYARLARAFSDLDRSPGRRPRR